MSAPNETADRVGESLRNGDSGALSPRGLFISALVIGSLGIIVGWWFFTISVVLGNVVTLAVPLASMGIYLGVGVTRARGAEVTAAFADSVYYLGFLFTLVALIVSLYGVGDLSSTPGVVSRFALALVTTVVGLAIRISLVSFRSTTNDARVEAEEDLTRAARRLQGILEQISRDMIVQNNLVKETLTKSIETTGTELSATVQKTSEALGDASQSMRGDFDLTSDNLRKLVDSSGRIIEDALIGFSTRITETDVALRDIVTAVKLPRDYFTAELKQPLANLKAYLTRHSKQVEKFVDSQSQLDAKVQSVTGTMTQMEAQVLAVGESAKLAADHLSNISDLRTESTALGLAMNLTRQHLVSFHGTLQKNAVISNELKAQAELDLEAIRKHREDLEEEVRRAKDSLRLMHSEIVKAAKYVAQELKE